MNNPYYIKPAVADISPVLEGIGSMVKESREAKKKADTTAGIKKAFAGGPDAIASYMAENPGATSTLDSMIGVRNDATKANLLESSRTFLSNPSAENLTQVTQNRADFVRSHGGSPAETEMSPELFAQNPEKFISDTESIYAAYASPQEWKAYQARKGVGGESGVHFGTSTIFQDTGPDGSGKFFYSTPVGRKSGGNVESSMVALDGSDSQPTGRIEMVSPLGLTSEQMLDYKRNTKFQESQGKADFLTLDNYDRMVSAAQTQLEETDTMINGLDVLADTATGASTGLMGLTKWIPAAPAKAWDNLKKQIVSNLAIEKLREMKAQSRTGASGMGQLNKEELQLLINYRGSLENTNSPKEIRKIIIGMQKLLTKARRRIVRDIKGRKEKFDSRVARYGYDETGTKTLPDNIEQPTREQVYSDNEAIKFLAEHPDDPAAQGVRNALGIK